MSSRSDRRRASHRTPAGPTAAADRRGTGRGRRNIAWTALLAILRTIRHHVRDFRTALGVFVIVGALLAVVNTWLFAWVASHVRQGRTQAFDDAVLRYVGEHRVPLLENAMLEITFLGTGTVVLMIAFVAALFLWLTRHRYSAALLVAATVGAIVLNNVLKQFFDRPRPQIITWGTHALTTSFPSGHAMSAAVVYSTIAYLAARLQHRRRARVTTMSVAAVLVILVCASRVYLGVHYPTDVLAGTVVGLAWAGFCMATLEAVQLYARRGSVQVSADEADPDDR
jgi:undecaprenyl-diphosphatase